MKLNYIKNGDYYIPDSRLDKGISEHKINKYGLLKLDWLKENKKAFYTELLMKNELNEYLFSVGNEAKNMVDTIVKFYIENDVEFTEKLKENNQMEWVQKMNNYKNLAEEFVLKELIYN